MIPAEVVRGTRVYHRDRNAYGVVLETWDGKSNLCVLTPPMVLVISNEHAPISRNAWYLHLCSVIDKEEEEEDGEDE